MVRLPVSRDLTALTVVAVVLTITSCSDSGVDYGRSDQSDYPTLQGQFAEEGVTEPLVAVEAFLDGSQFYVRYQSGEKTFYAGGEWANRIDLTVLQESAEPVFLGPFILPLGYQQIEPWEEVPGERITPRILDAEHFVAFRKSFLDSIVPTDEKLGIVMHFDVDDYFLYINDVGEFEARVLQDKPADYSYKDRVTFQELVSRGVPYLEAFLNQRGITDRRVVFNTGDAGRYSLPFFYVNLDLHLAVFVRYEPPPKPMPAGTGATPIAQTLGHVIQSHGPGIVVRPVSSLYRLFFVAADTAIETVRPEWMVSLESGPIAPLTGGPGMDLVEF